MKMTFKTAASIVLAVLGATLHAANTGSSEGSARTITPTRSSQTLAITVTRAYDDCYDVDASGNCKPGYSPDFYTYFVKVVLTKGQTYTFTATYLNDTMYGATPYSPDSSLSPQWDGGDTADGHAYDEFTILASDWNDVEGDTATLYFEFSGDSGGRASLSYKIGVDIPEGTSENPGYLYPSSGFSTATATLTDRHGGQYLYYADLTAGRKYRFLATSGTEAYPVDMNILPSDVSDVDISTETNDGYIITPVESDRYEIQLYTSAPSVALQYGAYPTRPVASHPSTALTPGTRAEFSPGHMNAGDSDYYDTIIDESLFSFQATAGRRYRIETDSVVVPVRMELYDGNGAVVASNSCVSASDMNVRVMLQTSAGGTYYVGVCQNVRDDDEIVQTRAGIKVVDVTDSTDGRSDAAAAVSLQPVMSAVDNLPAAIDPKGSGPYSISATHWRNVFAIAARAGWTYSLYAEGNGAGNDLAASVFTLSSATESAVATDGFITQPAGISWTASANATYYARVQPMDAKGFVTDGLNAGPYTLHAAAVAPSGSGGFSVLSVNAKGPLSEDGATWRISSGTSGTEPYYPYGATIPVIADAASFTVAFNSVSGLSTPANTNIVYAVGATNIVTAVYSDTYDPGDDAMSGANRLYFGTTPQTVTSRTLWIEDAADWYSFSATAGYFYTVAFSEATGAPRIAIVDSAGNELAAGTLIASYGATASGTYYVKVSHADDPERSDSSYKLAYFSTDVGYVSFSGGGAYSVDKGAEYAELTVTRSSSGGALRLDWGTAAGTAAPGEDYSPASGTLSWSDGDMTSRTIRVPLIPDVRPENEGNEKFYVKVAAKPITVLEDGEYPAIISGSPVAEVTIADTVAEEKGTISISSCGPEMTPLAVDTVSAHPGDTAVFWVTREGGSNGAVTATVTVDGEELTELRWESGETRPVMFAVKANPDPENPDGPVTRKVKIATDTEGVALGRSIVKLNVSVDVPAISYPGDGDELRLASGAFRGVLAPLNGVEYENGLATLADVAFSASVDGLSATVRAAGAEYKFTAGAYDEIDETSGSVVMTLSHEVNGEVYEDTLEIDVANAAFSRLNGTFDFWNTARLSLHLPRPDGVSSAAGEWSGELFRDSRTSPEYTAAASAFSGRYTVAFVPSEQPFDDEPEGNGYMTLEVAADGGVSGTGVLTDGTPFAVDSLAGFAGSLDGGTTALVPVYFCSQETLFGGVLELRREDGGARPVAVTPVYSDSSAFYWFKGDVSGGESVRQRLLQVGGYYDPSVDAVALLNGKSVFCMTDGYDLYFAEGTEGIDFSVDQETGVASGSVAIDGPLAVFRGVVLQNFSETTLLSLDGLFATGVLAAGNETYPFSVYADKDDGDYSEDFGLTSVISFNGNGNTAGYVPEAIEAAVGSIEFIPPLNDSFMRTGYKFVGWTDGTSTWQSGDEIKVPVSDVVLKAKWTIPVDGIAEALDAEGRLFSADGAAGWYPQNNVFVSGVPGNTSAIRSGAIGNSEESWIETVVDGPGMLSFWYLVSSEQNYDKLVVTIDGSSVGEFSGTSVAEWTQFAYEITSVGPHAVRWTYRKDSGGAGGEDAAWLDLLKFGPTVTVTFNAQGGTLETDSAKYVIGEPFGPLPEPDYGDLASFDGWEDEDGDPVTEISIVPGEDTTLYARTKEKEWSVAFEANGASGAAPKAMSGVIGTVFALPGPGALAKAGYEFGGWSDGSKTYAEGASYTISARADVALSAVWSLSVSGIAEALNAPKAVAFAADGDAPWFPADGKVDGRTAVQSGAITHRQSTTLTAGFSGSGYLSFWYKVSSESSDKLTITIDGTQVFYAGGNYEWTLVERELGDGDHTVVWEYSKDGSVNTGSDAAWISEFKFGPTVTVTFNAQGGTLEKDSAKYVIGEPFGPLPEPEYDQFHTFAGWADVNGNAVTAESVVPEMDVSLYAVVKENEDAKQIREALGGNVDFAMSGETPWFLQSDTVHGEGESALRSGAIGNSASSTFTTMFSGKGTLSFWYKVSSEQNYDKLTITLDGEEIGVFSGEVDWTQVERELDDGDHVLSLTYAKDGSSTRGSDAAWLADFAWTPAVAPEPDGWNVVDIGGKEVVADHDKAKAWCEANSVALENFAANYNDYLLNEAPGADGGIEIAGITRDLVKGVLLITVVRTKDSFALNAINGTIVLYASNILGAEFKPIASTEVTIAAEAESADLSIALPSESAAFYTVKIE